MLFIRRLIWDAWNVGHITRHKVSPEEVEDVCHGESVTSQTYKGRLRVVGPTAGGRMLTVILAPLNRGVSYPVTARPASAKERERYNESKRGGIP